MFEKNVTIASFYVILVIFSPQLTSASPAVVSLHSGLVFYQMIQILLALFDGIDTLTGNHISGAFSWTYHFVTNGTRVVTGTVPLPVLVFLAYKLPTAVQEISKRLGIEVKDIPKIVFNQPDKPTVKQWRRVK